MRKIKAIVVVIILISTIQFSFAQENAGDIFKIEFPELIGLNYDEDKELNKEEIEKYRKQYQQLLISFKDIETFQQGVIEGLSVFDAKDLKGLNKGEQLIPLKDMVINNTVDLKKYLSDKTQYGVDSVECIEQSSILKTLIDGKDYKNAYEPWKLLYNSYPVSSKNVYMWGEKLVTNKIKSSKKEGSRIYKEAKPLRETDVEKYNEEVQKAKEKLAEADAWVDTLLLVYDQRIKYYGAESKQYGEGYLIGKKGTALFKYRKKDKLDSAYQFLKKSVEMQADYPSLSTLQYFFFATDEMYEKEKIDAPSVVEDYTLTQDVIAKYITKLDKLYAKNPKESTKNVKESAKGVSDNITDKFANGKYAKCSILAPAFATKFEEHKTDVEWLKKVTNILSERRGEEGQECRTSNFYELATVTLYDLEPSAKAAFMLAQLYLKKEKPNYDEAAKYYEEAYTQETDSTLKAKYYYEAAVVASAKGQLSKSRNLAQSALDLAPNMGKAYILIGKLYVKSVSSCGTNSFEKSSVYWIAADMMAKARSVDSEVSDEASGHLNSYSQRFPGKEDAFMRGVKPGDAVSIGCWIQRTTTARFIK